MFRTHFQAKVIPKYNPTLVDSAHTLLHNLLQTPENLIQTGQAKLPYRNCIVQECLHWNPVGNIVLAHYLTEDYEYQDWCMAKGTTVTANIWSMLHTIHLWSLTILVILLTQSFSTTLTRQPSIPTGTQTDGVNPLPDLAYDFGRRLENSAAPLGSLLIQSLTVCPGRFLATDTVWIVAVSVTAGYNILKLLAASKSGKEVTPEVAYTSGLFSCPKPFGYCLVFEVGDDCRSYQCECYLLLLKFILNYTI
ncbi:hypothetical protein DFH07DRAFT_768601 [Mycena maculata]|uniref:Uncharacterized protein n=1 Tax=Mycena maculata TaxID=230809 RepID=A0AAD7NQ56_9AGAR|nr:hypothetical protein DFH07DRAFT_768601 [Mycena maculata]